MKNLIASLLLVFVSTQALAAELRLLSGETATIQANQTTRVTCEGASNGGGAVNCETAVNSLKYLVSACTSGGYSTASCMDKYWPNFKQNNSSCAYGAISICVSACSSGGLSTASCAEKCAR